MARKDNSNAPTKMRPRGRWRLIIFLACLILVAVGLPVGFAIASPGAAKHALLHQDQRVVINSANPYPATACSASSPVSLLLPTSSLPPGLTLTGMYAGGGQSISPLGMPEAGVTPQSSAAMVLEHAANTSLPSTALDGSDPYLAANPTTITAFNEGITGFTDSAAEPHFFNMSQNGGVTPDVMVNSQAQPADTSTMENVGSFPTPNVVTVTSAPTAADQAALVQITVESGSTVIGLSFSGGVDLSLSAVSSFAQAALNTIETSCHGLDIL